MILNFKLFLTILIITFLSVACSTPPKNEACFWDCSGCRTVPDCDWVCVDNELLKELHLMAGEMQHGLKEESCKEDNDKD